MKTFWDNEPAAILGAIQAVLAVIISFGIHLSAEQIGSIMAASSAVVALLVRRKVMPTNAPSVEQLLPRSPQAS